MFSFLSCKVFKLIMKWRKNVYPLGEESASLCCCRSWLPVGMQLLRQLFNCFPNLKGHCQVANVFHNNIWLLLGTTTVHFIELQQCAKHDRFITQQVHNRGEHGCSLPFLIFIFKKIGSWRKPLYKMSLQLNYLSKQQQINKKIKGKMKIS